LQFNFVSPKKHISDSASEAAESPRDVKKFLFKLEDLSGSLSSLEQPNEEHPVSQTKAGFRAEPPGSPLPEMLHPHELEIIEEQNEADNEESLAEASADKPKEDEAKP
jgi:hypothetical protein